MTSGPEAAVRRATPDDAVSLLRVLEGALLDVDPIDVHERVVAGEALVAVPDGDGRTHIVGALVRDGVHVEAVAVEPSWRRRGVGRTLVERASAAAGRLTAEFDPDVRGFYAALGFEISEHDGRLWGVRGSGTPASG
jgi:GNAT superfamily N-acetyltransferase